MQQYYLPEYYQIREIFIRQIILNKNADDNFVTILGGCSSPFGDALLDVDYGCELSLLTDLLLLLKEAGEATINLIVDKLTEQTSDASDMPCIVDIENLFGEPLKIENFIFTIYKPMEENEDGELEIVTDEFYLIDKFEVRKNETTIQHKMSGCMLQLNAAFRYYQKLIEAGLKKKKARRLSGLNNELLFQIAVLNNKMIEE